MPSKKQEGRDDVGISTSVGTSVGENTPSKLCAVCLAELSPTAMCDRCARLAASAFKDTHGSRRGRLILVPHGHAFGISEEDLLEREGDSVRRWTRLFDDSTDADFFYNVYYDSSVWRNGIVLPEAENIAKGGRRRRKGGGGGRGGGVAIDAPDSITLRKKTPSEHRSARSSRGSTTPIATQPAAAPGRPMSESHRPPSLQRPAAAARSGAESRGDGDRNHAIPNVVFDAHKQPYPKSRLVFAQIEDATAAWKGGG